MNNEPAFPSHGSMGEVCHEGVDLRTWLATKAVQAMIMNKGYSFEDRVNIAINSFDMASSMLKERGERL